MLYLMINTWFETVPPSLGIPEHSSSSSVGILTQLPQRSLSHFFIYPSADSVDWFSCIIAHWVISEAEVNISPMYQYSSQTPKRALHLFLVTEKYSPLLWRTRLVVWQVSGSGRVPVYICLALKFFAGVLGRVSKTILPYLSVICPLKGCNW